MAKAKKKKALKKPVGKKPSDFSDEEVVRDDMAKALEVSAGDLKIERAKHWESYGAGRVWFVYTSPGNGEEYYVVKNDEAAVELAEADVKQRLRDEPEMFNKDFLERHIDEKALAKALRSDVLEQQLEHLKEEPADAFWAVAKSASLVMYIPEEDEDGEQRDPTEQEIEDLAEANTDDSLQNPMQYLEDIYGSEDAHKQAIQIAGVDVDAAAAEAVRDDGAGNYLSSYDNETHETPAGFVYWRNN